MKTGIKKSWVVFLKEEKPNGVINFTENPDDGDVQIYCQLIESDQGHYSNLFRDGQWQDVAGGFIRDQLIAGNPLVVELVNLQPGFELLFGAPGQKRFSDETLKQIEDSVTNEPDRVKATKALIDIIYPKDDARALKIHGDYMVKVMDTIPGFAELSDEGKSNARVGAYLHHALDKSDPIFINNVLQGDLFEWGFSVLEINIAESFGRYIPMANLNMSLEEHLDWIERNEGGSYVKLACLSDTEGHDAFGVDGSVEARAKYETHLKLTPEQIDWLRKYL